MKVTGDKNKLIYVWNPATCERLKVLTGHRDYVSVSAELLNQPYTYGPKNESIFSIGRFIKFIKNSNFSTCYCNFRKWVCYLLKACVVI